MDKDICLQQGKQLIAKASAAVLTTMDNQGFPTSRAMLNLHNPRQYPGLSHLFEDQESLELYFTTNRSSDKFAQIQANPRVAVYYFQKQSWHGFLCQGEMEEVKNQVLRDSIWQEGWEGYYPEGRESKDYIILRLRPSKIRHYHRLRQDVIEL